jgi:hypothetical protein
MRGFKVVTILTALAAMAAMPLAHMRQLPKPQEAQEAMKRHREKTRGTVTTREALLEVLRSQGVPGGIVMLSQCDEPPRHRRPSGSSLHELLNSIVAADPQYQWQIESRAVNLTPNGYVSVFLEVRIARFRAANVRTPNEALGKLFETPEVQKAMTDPAIGSRLLRGGIGYYDPNPDASGSIKTFSVSRNSVTVREALNAIASAHGRAMWTHRENNCRGVHSFELDFSVW